MGPGRREWFLFLGFVLIGQGSLVHAQHKAVAGGLAGASSASASREEVEELRNQIAAQRKTIDELSTIVQRLVEANHKAEVISQQAQSEPAARPGWNTEMALEEVGGVAGPGKAMAGTPKTAVEKSARAFEAGWNGEHFFLSNSDGSFKLEPYGYFHFDNRSYNGALVPPNTFVIRRTRFGFHGSLGKRYQFSLLADFAERNTTLPREVALTVNYRPELQFEFGQFKEPFSQEELISDAYLDFVERSLVNPFVPQYSPGVQVSGQLLKGSVQYQAGVFNGKFFRSGSAQPPGGFLAENDNSTPEGVLRLRFSPWRNTSNGWLKGFAFGGAVAVGRTLNGTSFSGLIPTRTFTFFPTEPVNGPILRANGELTWMKGPLSIRTEYDQTNQWRLGVGPGGTNQPGVVAKAYSLSATYMLTGENRPENGQPTPRHSFLDDERHGIGAWELKFRYSNAQIEDGTLANRADQLSAGLNWYPTKFVRYMFDFNVERLKNPVDSPTSLLPQTFHSVLQRIQFRF